MLNQDQVNSKKIGFEGGQMPLSTSVPKLVLRILTV